LKKILIFGYGNPGRQDDALGIALADEIEQWSKKNMLNFISFETNYQLNIEDALLISEYDLVIFADASMEEMPHFAVTNVIPNQKAEFSMHAMSPQFVLHLCQKLYNKYPVVYLLHIKGYEYEFLDHLSQKAKENLGMAVGFLIELFTRSNFPVNLLQNVILKKGKDKTG